MSENVSNTELINNSITSDMEVDTRLNNGIENTTSAVNATQDDASVANNQPIPPVTVSLKEYVVTKILGKRYRNGRVEYRIKWKGYRIKESTWEPLHHIKADELIAEFEAELAAKIEKKKKKKIEQ